MKTKFLIIILILAGFIACNKLSIEDVDQHINIDRSPIDEAHDIEYLFSDSAIIKAKITAPLLENYNFDDNPFSEMKEGVKVVFYDNNLNPNAFICANYAKRFSRTKMTHLKDNVVVVNLKGDTLNTEHLTWDEKKEKVYSDKFVRVKTVDEIIYSEGFESDPSFSYYKFYKIKGTINLKEPE